MAMKSKQLQEDQELLHGNGPVRLLEYFYGGVCNSYLTFGLTLAS